MYVAESINFQNDKRFLSELVTVFRNMQNNPRELFDKLPPLVREHRMLILHSKNKLSISNNEEMNAEYIKAIYHPDNLPIISGYLRPYYNVLSSLIKQHTGMNIKIIDDVKDINEFFDDRRARRNIDFLSMYAITSEFTLNSTLTRTNLNINNQLKEAREFQHIVNNGDGHLMALRFNQDFQKFRKATGGIDFETGKVFGSFAENEAIIVIGFGILIPGLLSKTITPEEMAEMFLHEVGHIFTGYYFVDQTKTFNYALRAAMDVMISPNAKGQRKVFMEHIADHLQISQATASAISENTSPTATRAFLTTNRLRTLQSELNTLMYDATTGEALADNYVVRMGGGVHLVRAVVKLRAIGAEMEQPPSKITQYLTAALRYLTAGLSITSFPLALVKGAFLGTGIIFTIACGLAWAFLAYFTTMLVVQFTEGKTRNVNMGSFGETLSAYDNPHVAVQRVREAIIMNLRTGKITNKRKEELLKEIYEIDTVLKSLSKNKSSEDSIFFGMMSTSMRMSIQRDKEEDMLRNLESLAQNDLFIRAAELQLLAAR